MRTLSEKKSRKRYKNKKRRDNYVWVWEYKANTPCKDCGGKYHPVMMEFDHRSPTEKTGLVSALMSASYNRIMKEIEKCDLVCSNCHQYRTYTRGQHRLATLGRRWGEKESNDSNHQQLDLVFVNVR